MSSWLINTSFEILHASLQSSQGQTQLNSCPVSRSLMKPECVCHDSNADNCPAWLTHQLRHYMKWWGHSYWKRKNKEPLKVTSHRSGTVDTALCLTRVLWAPRRMWALSMTLFFTERETVSSGRTPSLNTDYLAGKNVPCQHPSQLSSKLNYRG